MGADLTRVQAPIACGGICPVRASQEISRVLVHGALTVVTAQFSNIQTYGGGAEGGRGLTTSWVDGQETGQQCVAQQVSSRLVSGELAWGVHSGNRISAVDD